jgi:hypothetical protein
VLQAAKAEVSISFFIIRVERLKKGWFRVPKISAIFFKVLIILPLGNVFLMNKRMVRVMKNPVTGVERGIEDGQGCFDEGNPSLVEAKDVLKETNVI